MSSRGCPANIAIPILGIATVWSCAAGDGEYVPQLLLGRRHHSVTSRSKRMISSSARFSSASIVSSGRGGVYL